MIGLFLTRTASSDLQPLSAAGTAVRDHFPQLRSHLVARLGSYYDQLLAEPSFDGPTSPVDWYGPEGLAVEKLNSLPPQRRWEVSQRARSMLAAVRIESDRLRATGESASRVIGDQLDKVLRVPSLDYVYVVDNKPVIVGWAHGALGQSSDIVELLALVEGGPPAAPPPRPADPAAAAATVAGPLPSYFLLAALVVLFAAGTYGLLRVADRNDWFGSARAFLANDEAGARDAIASARQRLADKCRPADAHASAPADASAKDSAAPPAPDAKSPAPTDKDASAKDSAAPPAPDAKSPAPTDKDASAKDSAAPPAPDAKSPAPTDKDASAKDSAAPPAPDAKSPAPTDKDASAKDSAAPDALKPPKDDHDPTKAAIDKPPLNSQSTVPNKPLDEAKLASRDPTFFKGCWSRTSQMQIEDVQKGVTFPVTQWRTCMDEKGDGNQRIVFANGESCAGPVHARFLPDGKVEIVDVEPCQGKNGPDRTIYTCAQLDQRSLKCAWQQPTSGRKGQDVSLQPE